MLQCRTLKTDLHSVNIAPGDHGKTVLIHQLARLLTGGYTRRHGSLLVDTPYSMTLYWWIQTDGMALYWWNKLRKLVTQVKGLTMII